MIQGLGLKLRFCAFVSYLAGVAGRVHKIFQGKGVIPHPQKFETVPHFLHQKVAFWTEKAHFRTEKLPLIGQFFIRTGAMHRLLEIDGCKCTRCTCAAAAPAYYTHDNVALATISAA